MAKKKTETLEEKTGTEKTIPVSLRLPEQLLIRLDRYRSAQRFPPTRQIVIERLLEDLMRQHEQAQG